ncbi:LysR substrate-binding domain-containing protein [Vibrio ordalii]|uniref:LysR family transcriptional regulator n=1 Tax=Vibrio TaxID=662 RepID=UPI000B548782|nr:MULTISPECIES: LysR family transcriptional regulator [Vibrio]ASG04634.1 LysR family transcriptional regulator [Vibrio anguillarum]MCS0350880.1 LysR substrate-binding domain-containing protein [Vibrio ordalii]
MLSELKRIAIFNKVVEYGSFTSAGESLGIAKSKVSEQVSLLESHLNVRLLHRSTRKVSLTTEGHAFYQHTNGLLPLAEDALRAVQHLSTDVAGVIRIGTTIDVGSYILSPLISTFSESYPNVLFDIQLDDGLQDPVATQLDVLIRMGELTSCSMVGRELMPFKMGIYASKKYLASAPLLRKLRDLEQHPWVALTLLNLPQDKVTLINPKGVRCDIKTRPKHICNAPLGAMSMVQQGMGIGLIANFLADEINDPNLVRLFPDYYLSDNTMNILYPSRHHLAPRVRLFIDYLIEKIRA